MIVPIEGEKGESEGREHGVNDIRDRVCWSL